MEYFDLQKYLEASGADSLKSDNFSAFMDKNDPLSHFRDLFYFPKVKSVTDEVDESVDGDNDCIYFCGNSLGLQCKPSRMMIESVIEQWAALGVEAWFKAAPGKLCWTEMEELRQPETNLENTMATLVGAKPMEVAVCASLTQNLNALLLSFYKPTPTRHKVLMESNAFPSDRYAIEAHITSNGYNPKESLICLSSRAGEHCIRTEDITEVLERHGHTIALVMFSGVQYLTGQLFEIEKITAVAQKQGCIVGWDLAHAVGNVHLHLHDWNVDFAAWCTYKYLNSGPGGIGALFLHERHAHGDLTGKRLAGWWAVDIDYRFQMDDVYYPRPGAAAYSQSTPDMLSLSSLMGSLQVFSKTDMASLRKKSVLLTSYLYYLLESEISQKSVTIITPRDSNQRGCQLSLCFHNKDVNFVQESLLRNGVVCDKRHPNIIRIAPTPLYSSFKDVRKFSEILKKILE